jgi:hypothetical protein
MATQHRDVVKLPPTDRRFEVLNCGDKMTADQRDDIRTWMASPENIGGLYRAFLMTPAAPLNVFDPYGEPPPFAGRLEMIGMAKSRIEDAYEAALDALKGYPLFSMTQAQRLIGHFGEYKTGDWASPALHTIAKNAYRLRGADEGGRMRYRKRKEIVYAATEADRRRWLCADKSMLVAQLDRTEERVLSVLNDGGPIDIGAKIREMQNRPREEGKDES